MTNSWPQSPHAIAARLFELARPMGAVRLVLAGAAGVGKTTAATAAAEMHPGISLIEQDRLRSTSGPCSLAEFDPFGCLAPAIESKSEFIIDSGASGVFGSKDAHCNERRLARMKEFLATSQAVGVLLVGPRSLVRDGYMAVPGSASEFFDLDWTTWQQVEQGYWRRCCRWVLSVDSLEVEVEVESV